MVINIRVADPGETAAHRSLLNWLMDNQYIKENARLSVKPTDVDAMGTAIDVIQLVLNSGFDLANLAMAFSEWRLKQAATTAPVVIQVDGMTTDLSLDDMADKKIVHRALSGAPAPQRSRCVLIGVSDYAELRPLPAVRQNLLQLEEVLTDPEIWGIPPERLHKIDYPQSADTILDVISSAADDAPDALLVYYAGHGLYDEEHGLLLALPDASEDKRDGTVPWNRLAEVIHQAHSTRRVVWLDCCYAGLALQDREAPPDLLGAAKVEGAYMLAAAQKYDEARSPGEEECTAFTGELVQVLRNGIMPGPPSQEFLSLNAIHQEVRGALAKKHRPQPQRRDPGRIGQFPHFHNLARGRKPRTSRPKPARGWQLPNLPYRYLAAAGAVIVLLVLLITRPWQTGAKSTPLGGVSLTQYCLSQHLTVNGGYCVRRVNLKAACNWQYHTTDLQYKFTSKDPDSAICYNSAVRYNAGITNMSGYCASVTGAADVVATADNANYKNIWVCQKKIDMNVVCTSTYKVPGLQARKDNYGNWVCYE